ncbi:MAG: tryptophan--tRNA ligase [Candidatus Paceibacterota bacterium]
MKKRLLSGIKPTGELHIGNYFGALKQFIDLQNDYEAFVFIADYHALNFIQNKSEMQTLSRSIAASYIACGLDPEKVVLFKQSDISAHTELFTIFTSITTMPYLMRAHAFKDAEAKNKDISVGTFNYPLLMASDILLYSPQVVPVGQDQKQHIEIARDTALKFNRIFNEEVFTSPEPLIIESVKTVPGLDGQKMSKSYNNVIPLFGTDEVIERACMSVVTNSNAKGTRNDPGDTLFTLISLFVNESEKVALKDRYETGELGYKEAKELLSSKIIEFITPLREKYTSLLQKPDYIDSVLENGAKKANKIASEKLLQAKVAIGVTN